MRLSEVITFSRDTIGSSKRLYSVICAEHRVDSKECPLKRPVSFA